jgi:co-chaperonin GroES (HSP10)
MIIPCGHRVLVKQPHVDEADDVYRRAREAKIEIVRDKMVREQEGVDVGFVIAIGDTAFKDYGGTNWCEVGDKIVFAKFAGKSVEDPNDKETKFVVINDEDVIAIVKE